MAWRPCCCGDTTCCPNRTLPNTLNWLLTTSGACACGWNGLTGTLTRDPTPSFAEAEWNAEVSGCADGIILTRPLMLYCAGSFGLRFNYTLSGYLGGTYACDGGTLADGPVLVSAECDPFEVIFTGTIVSTFGTCPCAGQTYTFTFTE
jgi:hypothetical protein